MFGALRAWFERRRALRELRAMEEDSSQGFSKFFDEQIEAALKAFNSGDREWALKTWRDMNERYPKLIMTSGRALNLLVDLGRYEEAEALIHKGRGRYPWHRAMYATVFARSAQGRGDFDEALRRCALSRRKFPRVAEGYTIAADCLASLDRQVEADAMIDQAARRFPRDIEIITAHARNAVRHKDWPNALRRWEAVKDRSNNFLGLVGMAQSLREMGRCAEAEELATAARERYPDFPWAYSELADIATGQGDLEGASQRWRIARQRCPDFARAYTAGAKVERRLGREAEADAILALAITRMRSLTRMRFDPGAHLAYARAAEHRGDRAAAAERWALVRERFPECLDAHGQDCHAPVATEPRTGVPRAGADLPSATQSSNG